MAGHVEKHISSGFLGVYRTTKPKGRLEKVDQAALALRVIYAH
jgi:hypothetical protein